MRPSSSELITAVADTIEKTVLPALNPADWTSSRLRSSLLILRHLERRVDLERALVEADNAIMRQVLVEVEAILKERLPEISKLIDVQSLSASGQRPDAQNEACNRMLDAVLSEIYAQRRLLGEEIFGDVRRRVVSCLAESQERMAALFEGLDGYSVL